VDEVKKHIGFLTGFYPGLYEAFNIPDESDFDFLENYIKFLKASN